MRGELADRPAVPFPKSWFNLACYEAQMGNLDPAKAHLKRATKADPKFRLMAMDDPDLEPLWVSLAHS